MTDTSPIAVILNVGSGHGDATTCERGIRAGFEAAGRQPQVIVAAGGDGIINALQVVVPRMREVRK